MQLAAAKQEQSLSLQTIWMKVRSLARWLVGSTFAQVVRALGRKPLASATHSTAAATGIVVVCAVAVGAGHRRQ